MIVNIVPLVIKTARVGLVCVPVPVGNLVTVIETSTRPLVKSITESVSLVSCSPTDDESPLPPP